MVIHHAEYSVLTRIDKYLHPKHLPLDNVIFLNLAPRYMSGSLMEDVLGVDTYQYASKRYTLHDV